MSKEQSTFLKGVAVMLVIISHFMGGGIILGSLHLSVV